MEFKICKYYGGADSAFTFTFDDGCYRQSSEETIEIFKKIYEETGVKIKATSAQTVNFLNDDLVKFWQGAVNEGWYDIAAHSVGHDICYNKETDYDKRKCDSEKSFYELKKYYPNEPIIAFVTPGGGSDSEGREVLKEQYVANRNGNDRINMPENIDWYDIGTFTATLNKATSDYINNIDKTIKEKGWGVQVNHWLTHKDEDIFHSQKYETFVEECRYISQRAQRGEVWIASLNEAIKYLKRAEKSVLEVTEIKDGYKVRIKDEKEGEKFDTPLTISAKTDKPITAIVDGEERVLEPKDGVVYIDVKNEATIKRS